jgi:hypothetical protein
MNLVVLRPIWSLLARDPRIALTFTAEDAHGVRAALARECMDGRLVTRRRAEWSRFDLALTADVWNHAPLRRCRRRINFFHGVAGKYDLDHPGRLVGADFANYDRVAFINADRMKRYLSSGVLRREQAVLVGFPKSDDLVNGAWPAEEVRRELGLPPDAATVLYAPTHSPASSLHLAGEAIIATLLEDGRNVIVKLHDRSMRPSAHSTAGIDWPARLSPFHAHPRFVMPPGADVSPLLAAADLLVTDHSTVAFEFALLDRPIVVFDAPKLKNAARIDLEKWSMLRSMADVVQTTADMREAVALALADPGRLRGARRRAHTLFAHAGSATARALTVVYQLLDLPPPLTADVSGRVRSAQARVAASGAAPAVLVRTIDAGAETPMDAGRCPSGVTSHPWTPQGTV